MMSVKMTQQSFLKLFLLPRDLNLWEDKLTKSLFTHQYLIGLILLPALAYNHYDHVYRW